MERRGCSRRRMLVWALGTICFVGAQRAPASAEDTTEVAKRQLAVALAGWEDAEREHRLDVSLRSQVLASTGYAATFPGLDVPPRTVGFVAPSEPMVLEGVVQGGEAALLHRAPAPRLAWYRGPGGSWMRHVESPDVRGSLRVRLANGQDLVLDGSAPGWARGQEPDVPTLELDLGATLDLAGLRAWLLDARSLRRWERASGGTQIRAMARPTVDENGLTWGAVTSLELTIELDTEDRLISCTLDVERSPSAHPHSVGLHTRHGVWCIPRDPLETWRHAYPRAPLHDPNDVLLSPARLRKEHERRFGPDGTSLLVLTGGGPGERLTLELKPRQAPTSRLMELFVARRRG